MITSRPWQNESDYARLRRFLQALPSMPEEGGSCTVGDLDWWRYTHNNPDKMNDVQFWLDDDRETIIGFVWPDENAFEAILAPRHGDLLPELVDWAEASARAQGAAEIEHFATDRDETRRMLLTERGYQPSETHYVYRSRPITGELEQPGLPEGFTFGDMRDATDERIEQRVNVHRAAWAPSKMTISKHRAVMASPTYRPDLDLVVEAPDGRFATCTIVWHDPVNRIGVFEPVGCDPEFRQRGLTRALMLEGMARLKALEARKAFVSTNHDNVPANRLYEAIGFELVDRTRKWVKPLA